MGPDATFQAFLAEGRFMIPRGASSGQPFFPPRVTEPGTGDAVEWFEASGRGVVYSATVVRKRPPESDYNVVLVELAEGPRVMSRVEGLPADQVAIGMAVSARIIRENDVPVLVFERVL